VALNATRQGGKIAHRFAVGTNKNSASTLRAAPRRTHLYAHARSLVVKADLSHAPSRRACAMDKMAKCQAAPAYRSAWHQRSACGAKMAYQQVSENIKTKRGARSGGGVASEPKCVVERTKAWRHGERKRKHQKKKAKLLRMNMASYQLVCLARMVSALNKHAAAW